MRKLMLVALVGLLAPAPAPAQDQDVAALFPGRTKAYLEINQVPQVVKELKSLLKGSFLDDMPGSMEKIMGEPRGHFHSFEMIFAGLYLSPETLDEVSRLKGGAIALLETPTNFRNAPDMLGILLTGESNLPHLGIRAMLGASRMRTETTVEGVRIYRERRFNDFPGKKLDFEKETDKDKKLDNEKFQVQAFQPDEDIMERNSPAVAMMPGAIIVGTRTKEVANMILRLKGKEAGATLASLPEFKKNAALRKDPGLFVHADFETLVALGQGILTPYHFEDKGKPKFEDKNFKFEDKDVPKTDEAKPQELVAAQGFGKGRETDPYQDLFASMKSLKTVGLALTLKNGTAELHGNIKLDTGPNSVWPEFFTTRTLNFDLLNYVPKDSRLALAVALPEGMKFWDKLGKAAPVLETDLAALLPLVDIEKINQVVVLDRQFPGERIHRQFFNFVVEAKDADTAKSLGAAPLKGAMSVEAKGRYAVFGPERKGLAEILAGGAAGQGLASEPKVKKALKDHEGAHALLVWSWGQKLADVARDEIDWFRRDLQNRGKDKKFFDDKKFEDREKFEDKNEGQVAFQQPKEKEEPGQREIKQLQRIARDFAKAVEDMPPFALSITRNSDQLIILGRQTQLQGTTARIIDLTMEGQITRMHRFRHGRGDRPPFEDFEVDPEKLQGKRR